MKFLTKLGQIILKGTEIWLGFAPLVQTALPGHAGEVQTVSQDLVEIAHIIVQVEAMGQALKLPGAQKLQAAVPSVTAIILQSTLLAHHKIGDPVLFAQGTQKVADGMADVLNALKDQIETLGKT